MALRPIRKTYYFVKLAEAYLALKKIYKHLKGTGRGHTITGFSQGNILREGDLPFGTREIFFSFCVYSYPDIRIMLALSYALKKIPSFPIFHSGL